MIFPRLKSISQSERKETNKPAIYAHIKLWSIFLAVYICGMTFFQINYSRSPVSQKTHIAHSGLDMGQSRRIHSRPGGCNCHRVWSRTISVKGVIREIHSLPSSLPARFWSNADIITSEEAEEVVKAMPVNRGIRAFPIFIRCFLFIPTEMKNHRNVHRIITI